MGSNPITKKKILELWYFALRKKKEIERLKSNVNEESKRRKYKLTHKLKVRHGRPWPDPICFIVASNRLDKKVLQGAKEIYNKSKITNCSLRFDKPRKILTPTKWVPRYL